MYPAAPGGAKPLTWTWWPRSIDTVIAVSPYLSPADTAIVALGVLSAIDAESGGRVDAVGDYMNGVPCSHSLFQMNRCGGAGTGYTVVQLRDPDLQFQHARGIVKAVESALYWSRIEGRPFTPTTVALASKQIQRCQDGFEVGYAKAWTRLQSEAGWTLP